ncbi:MAG: hypothetical protein MJ225_03215 [Bacilli bacterium]|nr:hypothetical protein [Bacilli bacterium]
MQIGNYLKKYQPVIYQTFVNSLQQKKISHAYLIVGNPGTPLLETAKYLAKTLICDDPSPLACDNCISCMRFDSDNFPDMIILDGKEKTIKKDDVLEVENRFDKTALDDKGIMIYIINLVENMTVEAVNSMLKFLEEPGTEIYAFLTTNNENNVLPTIISRCQTLNMKSRPRNDVIEEAIELNVNQEDAELLSYFYNDGESIHDFINNDEASEQFFSMKDAICNLLNKLADNDRAKAIFVMENEINPLVKSKEDMRYFLDILIDFFENILTKQTSKVITLKSYDTILEKLANTLPHVNDSLVEIMKQRNIVNMNLNISLQLDHIINYITKD